MGLALESAVLDDEFRIQGNRPGDTDALTLTPGKFMGKSRHRPWGHTDPMKQLFHIIFSLHRSTDTVNDVRLFDDIADGMPGIQ